MFLLSVGKMTKQDIKEILSIKGEVRGRMVQHAEALEKMAGKEALEKVEKRLYEWGYPMPKDELRKIRFYKLGEMVLYLAAIKETLNWDKSDFEKMGRIAGKNLILVKYLSPLFRLKQDFFLKTLPQFGNRFFRGLKIISVKADVKEKEGIFEIAGARVRSEREIIRELEEITAIYFSGLFASWAQFVLGSNKVVCDLNKNKKGNYVFKIKWL